MMQIIVRAAKKIARRLVKRPINRTILVYHRIAKSEFDPFNIAIEPTEFEQQLRRLRRKSVLPLREFVALHRKGRLPKDAVAITFDDGYACNALVAAPMLAALGLPATFFIVSDAITRQEEFWWDRLEAIVNAPGYNAAVLVVLARHQIETGPRSSVANYETKGEEYFYLWEQLRDVPAERRREALKDLRDELGVIHGVRPSHRTMSQGELLKLADNPLFEIGAHTVTHPALSKLSAHQQEQEVSVGKAILEQVIGKPVDSFAYPFGDVGDATPQIVSSAGFSCAVSAVPERITNGANLFTLPRRQAVHRYP
jgi:peptidoglycan/xylan/chitin deacetylase (PgdA/CDA1 family)